MTERDSFKIIESNIVRRGAVGLAGAGLSLLAACGGGNSAAAPATPGTSESTPVSAPFVIARSNYAGYRQDGKCDGGTPRPCSEPVYTTPDPHTPVYSNEVLNALTANGMRIAKPAEGDPVEVVCQVIGNQQSYADGVVTKVNDVLALPADSANVNQPALQNAEAKNPSWRVQQGTSGLIVRLTLPNGNEAKLYGYAASAPLDNGQVFSQLAPCTPAENPAGAPAVS